MTSIRSLRPNVTREEAVRRFSPTLPFGLLRQITFGPLRAMADVYLPFRVHKVEIVNGAARQTRFFGVDAVSGALDLYGFETAPCEADLLNVETRNRPEPHFEEAHGREILTNKVRRLLFSEGFFRLKDISIHAESALLEFHVPYWVGFFGREHDLHLSVLDAVRRRLEGPKISALLQRWLITPDH